MATLTDVAQEAGVSIATVSRVLNGEDYVKPTTRARVLAAVDKLGYSPNANARSLIVGQTESIGLIVQDIANPYWTRLTQGVQDVADEAGYTFSLCITDYSEQRLKRYVHKLVARRVDGLLLATGVYDEKLLRMLRHYHIPVVLLVPWEDTHWDSVSFDMETGSYEVTKYLISQGHERIAMIRGPEGDMAAQSRVDGFLRAMEEAQMAVPLEYVQEGNWLVGGGEAAGRILLSLPRRPTAVVTACNFTAIGLVKAAKELGMCVPGDVSVATFEDLGFAEELFPYFTTVTGDVRALGAAATRLLLRRIKGDNSGKPKALRLQPTLRPGKKRE